MSDHLDALDEQLDALDKFDRDLRAALPDLPVLIRKARARVRALRRDGTYRVTWHRGDNMLNVCNGLTPELAVARIIQAIENSGPITVTKVEREESCQTTS